MAFSSKREELLAEIAEMRRLQLGANQKASLEGWTRHSEEWYEMRGARISVLQRKLRALEQAATPSTVSCPDTERRPFQLGKTARPWQAVAADLAKEHDPDQIAALVDELDNALTVDQQECKGGNLGPRQG